MRIAPNSAYFHLDSLVRIGSIACAIRLRPCWKQPEVVTLNAGKRSLCFTAVGRVRLNQIVKIERSRCHMMSVKRRAEISRVLNIDKTSSLIRND